MKKLYAMQEKKMSAVVIVSALGGVACLESLLLKRTMALPTTYRRKKLTLKQARWLDFLAKSNCNMEYKPRHANLVWMFKKNSLTSLLYARRIASKETRGLQRSLIAHVIIPLVKTEEKMMLLESVSEREAPLRSLP